MSAYHKNPEFAIEWPDFLPGPQDPRWPRWAVVLAAGFAAGAVFAIVQFFRACFR